MDRVIRVCHGAGMESFAMLHARLLPALRTAVSFDAAFMAAVDPETLLFTAAFADEPLGAATPMFLDNEFGTSPDVNRFAALATAPMPVASLDEATAGERRTSSRSRQIMTPLGLGDEARVALRIDGTTWGFLCLHRSGSISFDQRELATLGSLAAHIGDAIRRTWRRRLSPTSSAMTAIPRGWSSSPMTASPHSEAPPNTGSPSSASTTSRSVVVFQCRSSPLLGSWRRWRCRAPGDRPQRSPSSRQGELVALDATRLTDTGDAGAIAISIRRVR